MIIAGVYSFNKGREAIEKKYPHLLKEIKDVISNIDAEAHRTKKSKESTMKDKMLFSPSSLNKAFKKGLIDDSDWIRLRVKCDYPTEYYIENYVPKQIKGTPFREMDFIKEQLGVEVQFGKYSFMVYNVAAKMTIFKNLGYIDMGVEIVPIKQFADEMSSGVSYFEQFVWDLKQRGIADIDIPVLIYGIDSKQTGSQEKLKT